MTFKSRISRISRKDGFLKIRIFVFGDGIFRGCAGINAAKQCKEILSRAQNVMDMLPYLFSKYFVLVWVDLTF